MAYTRNARAREVFCVTCGALAGTACVTGAKPGAPAHVMRSYHVARREFAELHITTEEGGRKFTRQVSVEGPRSQHFRGVS
jgi:hypothetical protein